MTAADTLALLDWKRRVFALYEDVRTMEPEEGWKLWRETRDELFRSHPQSPLPAEARAGFEGLEFWPYDPEARVLAELEDVEAPPQPIETLVKTEMARRARFRASAASGSPRGAWLTGYGGGVFPIRDATSGKGDHGGGRYVPRHREGATWGRGRPARARLQLAQLSCAYDPGWVCPLAPPANRLAVAVEAGERYAA
jgi:uncharacterized protein (DUF1684 family)